MASIRERTPGHFQITVSCGSYPSGKKHIESTTFVADPSQSPKQQRKAAEEYARRFEDEIHSSTTLDGRKTTLREFSERWLSEYAELHLEAKTVEKYKEELNDKILPTLGRVKLHELRPPMLNSFFVSLTKDGARQDGKKGGYSKASITKTKNVLSSVLRSAVEWEIIEKNPCKNIRIPSSAPIAETIKYFSTAQAIAFLEYIEKPYTVKVKGHKRIDDTGKAYIVGDYEIQKEIPEQIRILFYLAIYGGFRKGELLALQFSDINYENGLVHITKSVTTLKGRQSCKNPKTKTSVRTVSIPKFIVERIARLRNTRKEQKLLFGEQWKGDTWLFITDKGTIMNYSTPYQAFQDALARYNQEKEASEQLPVIPFHGLRHTSATLLISTKQDIATVSKRLGHANPNVTLSIYTHALSENDRTAADALESLLEK